MQSMAPMRWASTDRGVQKFPTWVDLKGKDAVPETVHHVLLRVDPKADKRWTKQDKRVTTDGKPNAQFRFRRSGLKALRLLSKRLGRSGAQGGLQSEQDESRDLVRGREAAQARAAGRAD